LASGIEHGESGNKALVFRYDLTARRLEWRYRLIKEL